jgi:hypothetical protein
MAVFHKIEACGRCRGATMWRLTNGKLQCGSCHRRKRVSRRRPSPVDVAAAACGLFVIVATWVAFAFGESGHQREIAQAPEPVLTEQSDQDDAAATDAHQGARLEERLKSAGHSTLRTLEVSMPEFVELQRLDDNGRRQLLGLPAPCTPGVTAMMAPASSARRLVVLITCSANRAGDSLPQESEGRTASERGPNMRMR